MDDNVSEPTPDHTAEAAADRDGSTEVTADSSTGSDGAPAATAEPDGAAETGTDPDRSAELRQHLDTLDTDQREEYLGELVRAEAETILKNPIALDSNFLEKGLNSLTALELAKTLIDRVGTEVPMVAIVENPTPAELGRFLAKEYAAGPDPVG